MKLFKKFKSQIEPMEVVTFNPLNRSKAENEIKPRFHASILNYWNRDGHFNNDLYLQIINAKNQ